MSVNYECVIMRGWQIPIGLQETINELTEYKYENNWWYPDGYYGYYEEIFLAITLRVYLLVLQCLCQN